jgi:Protein of unknown function (DUF1573)
MKKILVVAAMLIAVSPSFSQTKKKKAVKKATTTVKKDVAAKPVAKEVSPEEAIQQAAMMKEKAAAEQASMQKIQEQAMPVNTAMGLEKEQMQNAAAQAAQPVAPPQDASKLFEFKNDAYDFGKIQGGKPAEYDLFIKNISKEPAELTLVQPGCGCTTPKYEAKKKFAPGETVKVTLGYNGGSPSSAGPFTKGVTITLNGNVTKSVTFKGETYAAPVEAAPANGNMEKLKPQQ